MSDIRIYSTLEGTTLIGEYVEKMIDGGPAELKDPAIITLQAIPGEGGQPRMMPTVMPINMFTRETDRRGATSSIDIDSANLIEFYNIPLENLKFLTDQYNQLMSSIDLTTQLEL